MTDKHIQIRLSGEGLVSNGEVFAWVHEANPDAYAIAESVVRTVNSHALVLDALLHLMADPEVTGHCLIEDYEAAEAAIRAATGEDA